MKLNIFRICSKVSQGALEIVAVVAGLSLLLGGLGLWRLSAGPVDVSFAKEYIEDVLHDADNAISVEIGSAHLQWPAFHEPLALTLRRSRIIQDKRVILSVESFDVGVAPGPLVIGRIAPVSVTLQAPSLRLIRTADQGFSLTTRAEDADQEMESPDPAMLTGILARLAAPPRNKVTGPLDILKKFEIKNARMVVEDHVLGVTWLLAPLDMAFVRDAKGLVLTAGIDLPGRLNKYARLSLDGLYLRATQQYVLQLHVQDFDPRFLARKVDGMEWFENQNFTVDGDITIQADEHLTLQKAELALTSRKGILTLDGIYEAPIPFDDVSLRARFDRPEKFFAVENLSVGANGITVTAAAKMTAVEAGLNIPVTIKIPDLPQNKIAALWPVALKGMSVEKWLLHRLSGGRIYDAEASINLTARRPEAGTEDARWTLTADDITAAFAIEDMDVDYNTPMLPVKAADGKGTLANDTLKIEVTDGKIDALDIKKATIDITKVTADEPGEAKIDISLSGPLGSVFAYIAPEPIGVNEARIGVKASAVKGIADINAKISFPTLADLPVEKVQVAATGTVRDFVLPGLVRGLDVTGGPMVIKVADATVEIDGRAKLAGRDGDMNLFAYFDSAGKPFSFRATADIVADDELRRHFGAELEDWMTGPLPARVVYTEQKDGAAQLDVTADVTPVTLMVKALKFEKPPGVGGTAGATVLLNGEYVREVKDLRLESPTMKMQNGRLFFETQAGESVLRRGNIARAVAGETDVAFDFEQDAAGLLKMTITGPFFDARAFLEKDKQDPAGKKPYEGPAIMATVKVDRLRPHTGRLVEKARVYLDMGRMGDINQMDIDAVAGKGALFMRFRPDPASGKTVLRMEAADAGAALYAFDIYENVEGGKLKIQGESISQDQQRRLIRGKSEMTDFNVVKAPVLAQLLGAMSLTGIPQLLNNEGIYFERLESDFDWVIRRQGDVYYIRDGGTAGSSLGLTFQGRVDKSDDTMDINGTIVPVSLLNKIIGSIPLVGDILTGGDGSALIAATYTIKGDAKKPVISVNPLAALAPGILRKLLFEDSEPSEDMPRP